MTATVRQRAATPGATRRRCSTRPPRSSSRRAWRRRYATSPPRPASGWARSTATSRRGRTSIVAVYRHQVDACAEAGPALLASSATPYAALGHWIDLFVDFLVTKHGLAAVLQSDNAGFETLHTYFLDRLVPVCAHLLDAAVEAGEIRGDVTAYELMRGVGNLCVGAEQDPGYDARRLVALLVAGLRSAA